MDRRKVVIAATALALVGGVALLRTTGSDDSGTPAKRPPPTALKPFAADGVVIPSARDRPATPGSLTVRSGHHRLRVGWTGDAPGYEVRWGDQVRFVTRPAIQLDGLENGRELRVEVRAVDAFGQRSEPASAGGTPQADNAEYSFVDRFDGERTPDPARWRLAKRSDCARATPGDGDDRQRLVVTSSCATNVVSLRSRAPFVRDGESRLVVETDAPNSGGELLLDLVPGPVSVQPDAVPPDAVRLAVQTDAVGNTLVELFPDGTSQSLPQPLPGVSARWELVLTSSGVRAMRDGVEVASSSFVPSWREATALVGVAALAGDRTRAGIDLIGFRGGATSVPDLVQAPDVNVIVGDQAPPAKPRLDGVTGGQLRLALVPAGDQAPNMKLLVAGSELALRPAVAGLAWRPDAEYLAVVDVPPEAIGTPFLASLRSATRVRITHADLELTGVVSSPPSATPTDPLSGRRTSLATPRAELLDGGGQPVTPGAALSRGRAVLEVRMDSLAPAVSGLAGFDVRLDDSHVATIPTAVDGPGIAGRWRISLNTATLSMSPHTVEVRAFSTDSGTPTESVYVSFVLRP